MIPGEGKKDRVDDALNGTRAAVEEGIVPGGGTALLRARAAVNALKSSVPDVQAGINLGSKALEAPLRQIVENAGLEGSIVVGKIGESNSLTFGFNAQTEKYVDMVEAGIVDPTKVVRTALQNAASVAGLRIMTESMIADAPKDKSRWPCPGDWHGRWHGFLASRSRDRVGGSVSGEPERTAFWTGCLDAHRAIGRPCTLRVEA